MPGSQRCRSGNGLVVFLRYFAELDYRATSGSLSPSLSMDAAVLAALKGLGSRSLVAHTPWPERTSSESMASIANLLLGDATKSRRLSRTGDIGGEEMAASAFMTGSATRGRCCSLTRRTSPRSARRSSATWRRSSLSSTAEIRRSSGSRSIRSAPTRRWAADIEETQGTAPIEPALLIFYKNPLVPPCEEEGLKSINNGHNRDR